MKRLGTRVLGMSVAEMDAVGQARGVGGQGGAPAGVAEEVRPLTPSRWLPHSSSPAAAVWAGGAHNGDRFCDGGCTGTPAEVESSRCHRYKPSECTMKASTANTSDT